MRRESGIAREPRPPEKAQRRFASLRRLLGRFFQCRPIRASDLRLSAAEWRLFEMVLFKKGYAFECQAQLRSAAKLMQLTRQTTTKRLEERLKTVFKMAIKYLRKHCAELFPDFRAPGHARTLRKLLVSREDKFFWFFFYDFCERSGLSFRNLFKGFGKLRQRAPAKRPSRLASDFFSVPISVDFLRAIRGNEFFFSALKPYLLFGENELRRLESPAQSGKNILSDFSASIDRKVSFKVQRWERLFDEAPREDVIFERVREEFAQSSFKLPWSMMDICLSLRLFKEIVWEA